jgi:uncharacterized protein (TIGR03083 family)
LIVRVVAYDDAVHITEYLAALDRDGALFADAAQGAGLLAPVPTCPAWQVRDLVWHLAYVHAWAARHVRDQLVELIDDGTEAEILACAPPDDGLLAGYRDGHAALVTTLRDAAPDVRCVTFMQAPSPLAFWARRQAHETAIHRYDAQAALAAGPPAPAIAFAPAFADDGLDELIMGFAARRRYRLRDGDATATHRLAIRPADTAGRWQVTLSGGDTTVSRCDPAANPGDGRDCVLSGPASALYAFLWNRVDASDPAVSIDGDPAILSAWGANVAVAW